VSDRIELWWTAEGQVEQAVAEHAGSIAAEVLAASVHAGTPGNGPGIEGPEGARFWVARADG
jgi:isoleucyl-tRNA synthetase